MTTATSVLEANRRTIVVCIGVFQVLAFGVAVSSFASHWGVPEPWPTVVAFGTILAQCSLAAAFAVFGSWRLLTRAASSAAVVVAGGVVIVAAEARTWRFQDAIL